MPDVGPQIGCPARFGWQVQQLWTLAVTSWLRKSVQQRVFQREPSLVLNDIHQCIIMYPFLVFLWGWHPCTTCRLSLTPFFGWSNVWFLVFLAWSCLKHHLIFAPCKSPSCFCCSNPLLLQLTYYPQVRSGVPPEFVDLPAKDGDFP